MTSFLGPSSDRAVRNAVDAYLEGRLRPDVSGETVFETRNSRYRLLDGTLFSATDTSLVGAELVGWLVEGPNDGIVSAWWRPGARAVLVDRRHGRHIVVTSATRLLRVDGRSNPGSEAHPGGSIAAQPVHVESGTAGRMHSYGSPAHAPAASPAYSPAASSAPPAGHAPPVVAGPYGPFPHAPAAAAPLRLPSSPPPATSPPPRTPIPPCPPYPQLASPAPPFEYAAVGAPVDAAPAGPSPVRYATVRPSSPVEGSASLPPPAIPPPPRPPVRVHPPPRPIAHARPLPPPTPPPPKPRANAELPRFTTSPSFAGPLPQAPASDAMGGDRSEEVIEISASDIDEVVDVVPAPSPSPRAGVPASPGFVAPLPRPAVPPPRPLAADHRRIPPPPASEPIPLGRVHRRPGLPPAPGP